MNIADSVTQARRLRRMKLLADPRPSELPALDPIDSISDDILIRHSIDDIEIRLYFRIKLAVALDFPEPAQNMLFPRTAQVSNSMLYDVEALVGTGDSNITARQEWMAGQKIWQRYLRDTYRPRFDALHQHWEPARAYLSGCMVGELDPEMPPLGEDALTVLQTQLPDKQLVVDGKLVVVELGEGELKNVNDAIMDQELIQENGLCLSLTQEIEASVMDS
jgi:hypothetical protein